MSIEDEEENEEQEEEEEEMEKEKKDSDGETGRALVSIKRISTLRIWFDDVDNDYGDYDNDGGGSGGGGHVCIFRGFRVQTPQMSPLLL